MRSHHPLPALLVIGFMAMSAQAQQGPPAASKPSIAKDCAGLKDQALRECQKVARQVEQSANDPQPAETTNSPMTKTDDVHHSSPIMATKEERVVSDARKQGKDPRQELDKLEKRTAENPAPPQKSPE